MIQQIVFNILILLILASCASFKEKIGLTHYAPNEFETIQNDPLEIPSNIQLENPEDSQYKRKRTAEEKVRSLLISPSLKKTLSNDHKAEENLLKQIGTDKRETDIRYTLDRENTKEPTLQEKIQRTLVFWKKPEKGKVIDPHQEQKKLNTPSNAEEK